MKVGADGDGAPHHDEFLVLCLLADQPGNTLRMTDDQGRGTARPPQDPAHLSVACLQHAGLVVREGVSGDRRRVAVTLTDKAWRLLTEESPALARTLAEAIGHTVELSRAGRCPACFSLR